MLTDVGGHGGSGGGDDDDDATDGASDADASHGVALSVIMYIGVVVSVVCCVLTLATYVIFPELRTTAKWILCNLCAALAVGEVLFVAGIVVSTEGDGVDPGTATSTSYDSHLIMRGGG